MKALILAGGRGTRLGQLTDTLPKPLLPIRDLPFLAYLITSLKQKGIKEFILAIGYLGNTIQEYFEQNPIPEISIQYSLENPDIPLGTGGAIKNAKQFLDTDDFFILNGDSFIDIDIKKVLDFHTQQEVLVTMVGVELPDVTRYGKLTTDSEDNLLTFNEKGESGPGVINSGVYLCNKKIFDYFPDKEYISLEKDIFPDIIHNIKIYKANTYFIDIGIPADYEKAQTELPLL